MPWRTGTTDQGFTLVELLVTVVILGVAFAVFIGGMTTGILGSDVSWKQATAETLLRRFAESVKGDSYSDCATSYGATFSPPTGYTKSLPAPVKYWNGTTFVLSCPPDGGLQLVTLRVASNDGRDTETVEIVKRRP